MDGQGAALMREMRANEKAAEERAAKPHLALIYSISIFLGWAFFAFALLWFLGGIVYGLVLIIRKYL